MFQFPSDFPGATIMHLMSQGRNRGILQSRSTWERQAEELEAAGFTPADYLLLRTHLRTVGEKRINALEPGRYLIDTSRSPGSPPTYFTIATDWSPWLKLVREGTDPLRAIAIATGIDGDADKYTDLS